MVEKNNAVDEAKDQVKTRAGAIKEHMSNPEWKSNKGENVVGDLLTKSKTDVKTDQAQEGWKNTGINAYESVKESVSEAAINVRDWVTGNTEEKK